VTRHFLQPANGLAKLTSVPIAAVLRFDDSTIRKPGRGLMKMFEYCPNVKPEKLPPVSAGADAVAAGVAAGEGRFRSQLPECYAKSSNPLLPWGSTLRREGVPESLPKLPTRRHFHQASLAGYADYRD